MLESAQLRRGEVTITLTSGRFTLRRSAGLQSIPASCDQIVAAFSIMCCMTLKCRTAVPGEGSRRAVSFSYQRETATLSTSRTNRLPNSSRMPSRMLFSRFAERFLLP